MTSRDPFQPQPSCGSVVFLYVLYFKWPWRARTGHSDRKQHFIQLLLLGALLIKCESTALPGSSSLSPLVISASLHITVKGLNSAVPTSCFVPRPLPTQNFPQMKLSFNKGKSGRYNRGKSEVVGISFMFSTNTVFAFPSSKERESLMKRWKIWNGWKEISSSVNVKWMYFCGMLWR